MRVLVTAGGTVEPIDEVRGITNFSTGRLGQEVASCYSRVEGMEVTYICGRGAQRPPESATVKIIEIGSTQELLEVITRCLIEKQYDVIVHSMAVSDYYLMGSSSEQELLANLLTADELVAEELKGRLDKSFQAPEQISSKLSSGIETLYLQLKQTPKVISVIKKLQPEADLVGFKLLVDVSPTELLGVAQELLEKNNCDFVLANDKKQITGDQHVGYLINSTGDFTQYLTKQAIAQGIVEQTMKGGTPS